MNCFYANNIPLEGEFTLSEAESKHVTQVLRLVSGDKIEVTNGEGTVAICEVVTANKRATTVQVNSVRTKERAKGGIHLWVAPPKSTDRWNFILEKAQELNALSITPIRTFHSERKAINEEKAQAALVAALKQSRSGFLTKYHGFTKLTDALKAKDSAIPLLVASCSFSHPRTKISDCINKGEEVVVAIGPEGDFSEEEVLLMEKEGFSSIELGETILRTETACVFVMSAVKLKNL